MRLAVSAVRRPLRPLLLLVVLVMAVMGTASAGVRGDRVRRSSSAIIFPEGRRSTEAPVAGCRDYAGRPGRCVPFSMCPAMAALLAADGPTRRTVTRLRAGGCGMWRGGALVCCAHDAAPPTAPPPPEQHPNLAVLERGEPCGFTFQPNIFGGRRTRPGEFPWVAALAYTRPGLAKPEVNCGGALIGRQYVLTAAHCVANLPDQFRLHSVLLGEHVLNSAPDCSDDGTPADCLPPAQRLTVTETLVHPRYDRPVRDQHDIALLRLARPATENAGVAKLCLPLGAARLADPTGTHATVAGFGLTEHGELSDTQLAVRLPVLPQANCSREIGARGRQVGPGQLCAGGLRGVDSCVGDSGGPLFLAGSRGPPYHVIGVTSFGPLKCGSAGVPGVYTRVTEYLDWILDNVRD